MQDVYFFVDLLTIVLIRLRMGSTVIMKLDELASSDQHDILIHFVIILPIQCAVPSRGDFQFDRLLSFLIALTFLFCNRLFFLSNSLRKQAPNCPVGQFERESLDW